MKQLASIPDRKKVRKKKDDPQGRLFDYDDLSTVLAEVARGVSSITQVDEDDTDAQKAILDEAQEAASNLRPLADLYTAYLMDPAILANDYKYLFEFTARGKPIKNSLNPTPHKIFESVGTYSQWHRFYHWPLEFPDVFGPDREGGFSATVGNPPWDIVKPNSQEFFSDYDPKFRSYKKQEANRVSKKLMADNPAISSKWQEYCDQGLPRIIYLT